MVAMVGLLAANRKSRASGSRFGTSIGALTGFGRDFGLLKLKRFRCKQPHDFTAPDCRRIVGLTENAPQSQTQIQDLRSFILRNLRSASAKTSKRPNRWPTKLLSFVGGLVGWLSILAFVSKGYSDLIPVNIPSHTFYKVKRVAPVSYPVSNTRNKWRIGNKRIRNTIRRKDKNECWVHFISWILAQT